MQKISKSISSADVHAMNRLMVNYDTRSPISKFCSDRFLTFDVVRHHVTIKVSVRGVNRQSHVGNVFIFCFCVLCRRVHKLEVFAYFRLVLSVVCKCWYCLLIPFCSRFIFVWTFAAGRCRSEILF